VAKGEASDHDKHNKFYDEYLAVMDMTAEFYLSTVERIFKGLEIAQNRFTVDGKRVDIGKITTVAVKTVEGGKDDISAPGQCVAALDLCTGLPESKKANYLEPNAGHYGIFAGRSWRDNIRPLVLDFIDANCDVPKAPVKGVAAGWATGDGLRRLLLPLRQDHGRLTDIDPDRGTRMCAVTATIAAAPTPISASPAAAPRASVSGRPPQTR
jgi:hypothetical protein